MNNIKVKDTITSLELLKEINKFREEEYNYKLIHGLELGKVEKKNGKYTELKHYDLLDIIKDEFSEEINDGKISVVNYVDKKGENRPMYILSLEQAKQVLLRESKYVRKAVIQYIDKLENKIIELQSKTNRKTELLNNIMNSQSDIEMATNIAKFNIEYVVPLEKKEEYHDNILDTEGTLTVSQMANDYGKSARWLNKYLADKKIQYKKGSQWYLYQEYKDKGYAREITIKNEEQDKTFTNLRWTNKGRKFIYDLLAEDEIYPIIANESELF